MIPYQVRCVSILALLWLSSASGFGDDNPAPNPAASEAELARIEKELVGLEGQLQILSAATAKIDADQKAIAKQFKELEAQLAARLVNQKSVDALATLSKDTGRSSLLRLAAMQAIADGQLAPVAATNLSAQVKTIN